MHLQRQITTMLDRSSQYLIRGDQEEVAAGRPREGGSDLAGATEEEEARPV